jgi:hypothetical protein
MLVCGCHEEVMTNKSPPSKNQPPAPPVSLAGETVDISYVSDPKIGHGSFRLSNAGDAAVSAGVVAAWLELGNQRKPLDQFTVFDLAKEHMVDPKHFEVGAKARLGFLLGFPTLAYEPGFGESAAVGVTLSAGGAEVTALSPLRFVRRMPRKP